MMLPTGRELIKLLNARVLGRDDDSDAVTVVLAHGFGSTQSLWEKVWPSLINHGRAGKDFGDGNVVNASCGFRVVVFDWPGASSTVLHSFSHELYHDMYYVFAQILVSLLEELNITRCTFVGHSMSAMVGCIAALHHPSLFRKLILVGASPRYLNDDDYYGGFEQEDLDQLFDAMTADFEGWAARFARLVVGVDDDENAIQHFTSTLAGMQEDIALAMAKEIFHSDFRGTLKELIGGDGGNNDGVEISVLQMEKDVAVPMVVTDYFKRGLGSRATVEALALDGHLPQLTAPQSFSSALLRHLMN